MVRTFGALGAKLADVGVSTAAELAKALVDAGVPKGEASYLGQQFEGGGIVVTVQARTDNIGGANPEYSILTDPDDAGERQRHWGDQWHFALSRMVVACRAYGLRPIGICVRLALYHAGR